ncbi:MAG: spheroidene monooxygenase, partial [Rhodobacteraceae bacterium]|nr:spheroidene monooxygenase [Paracoccaceae bacterium]
KPNWGVYAILCVWQDPTNIEKTLKESRVFRRYHEMATESVTIHLETYATRGEWSGQTPFRAKSKRDTGPVAVLTRATLRWNAMLQFWKQSPAISTKIGMNEDVLFKIGLGEVPLRQQLTFSIWPDIKQMSEFAHQSDPHRSAIQKVRQGDWFKEELYARFNITAIDGHWSAFGTTRKKEETNE